jgi:hypothetical protein
MKPIIWIGITVGSGIGGLIGGYLDGGFGIWSILLSTVGGLAGIWAGYKLGKMYF